MSAGSPTLFSRSREAGEPSIAVNVQGVSHFFEIADLAGGERRIVKAVDNVSMQVPEHCFVSLVGPSGCGKTTLLNIIAGLETLQVGTIEVAGAAPKAGSRAVAYMLARDALLPWRDVEANARFGLEVRGVPAEQSNATLKTLLELVGLGAFMRAKPRQLSQGMRQRVALARTFALPSSVLLMDEPFGALDAQTKLQLQGVLLRLWERDKRTVILVTHDLQEAIGLSDRVVVMSARPGRIKAVYDIPLSRPRVIEDLLAEREFIELYRQIRMSVEETLE